MKKIITGLLLIVGLSLLPTQSHAYIGASLGLADEDNFGVGLTFGGNFTSNIGIEAQLVSFWDTGTVDFYWIQSNIDVFYDLNSEGKKAEGMSLHPYLKGGFTYATSLFDTPLSVETSYGPGFNVGGGLDYKLLAFMTIGIDITESFIWMNGVTVAGLGTTPDQTAKVFNALAQVKFFAY